MALSPSLYPSRLAVPGRRRGLARDPVALVTTRRGAAATLVAGLLALLMVWDAGPARALDGGGVVSVTRAAPTTGEILGGAAAKMRCPVPAACLVLDAAVVGGTVGALTADIWMPWLENTLKEGLFSESPATFDAKWGMGSPSLGVPGNSSWSGFLDSIKPELVPVGIIMASTCRTSSGLLYQVNSQATFVPSPNPDNHDSTDAWLTTDPLWVTNGGGGRGYRQTFSRAIPRTGATGQPSTALDGVTPNPARGYFSNPPETPADELSLCNSEDTLTGMRAVGTAGGQKTFDYGDIFDPNKAQYDSTVNCLRPDGSRYSKVAHSSPQDGPGGGGSVLMPHCDPGDVATGGSVATGGKIVTEWDNPATGFDNDMTPGDTTWSVVSPANASSLLDGNLQSQWYTPGRMANPSCSGTVGSPSYSGNSVTFKAANAVKISGYRIAVPGAALVAAPIYFRLEGSSDGSNWATLSCQANVTGWASGTFKDFTASGTVQWLRLVIQSSNNGAEAWLSEFATIKPAAPTANPALSDYPSCVGASPACTWTIDVNGVRCTPGVPACVQWTREALAAPSHVTCRYGPYVVEIAKCYWLERSFETTPEEIPATRRNTDGNPDTWDAPKPAWAPEPQPTPTSTSTPTPTLTDAGTVRPAPTGTVAPFPTSTATSTATATGTVTQLPTNTVSGRPTAPGDPGTGTDPNPAPTEQNGECFPSGWGAFNPVEWVVRPIKCGLSWAFIPSDGKIGQRATQTRVKLETSGPGPIITAMGDNIGKLSGGGCGGIPVHLELEGQSVDMHFGEACSGAMANLATLSRAISSLVIIVGGGFALTRALSSGFGFNFSMGSRGGDGS